MNLKRIATIISATTMALAVGSGIARRVSGAGQHAVRQPAVRADSIVRDN